MKRRVYFDWNATTPLCAAARSAMISAMDVLGNPSSVHAEGRAAKAIIERARGQVADAFGAGDADIIFTSSATESAALACAGQGWIAANIEHDAVAAWVDPVLVVDGQGQVCVADPGRTALQLANSETGVVQSLPQGLALSDMTQAFGKLPASFAWSGAQRAMISAHKLGGPKGIGALVVQRGLDVPAQIRGGGQEMGRRSGTENVIGIAGFGAAAAAAAQDLANGVWERVAQLRTILEISLDVGQKEIIFVGKGSKRLPNTTCFAVPGWKGETQVMQMDLAGFAISAGSACSSGKVKTSRVLGAYGLDDAAASSAIRVSIGPDTTQEDVHRFAEIWTRHYTKFKARGA
jgi:cysteine desulfurase